MTLTYERHEGVEHGEQEEPNENPDEEAEFAEQAGRPHERGDEQGDTERDAHQHVDPDPNLRRLWGETYEYTTVRFDAKGDSTDIAHVTQKFEESPSPNVLDDRDDRIGWISFNAG